MLVMPWRRRRELTIGSRKFVTMVWISARYPVVTSLGADRSTWGAFRGSLPDWCPSLLCWRLLVSAPPVSYGSVSSTTCMQLLPSSRLLYLGRRPVQYPVVASLGTDSSTWVTSKCSLPGWRPSPLGSNHGSISSTARLQALPKSSSLHLCVIAPGCILWL